MSAKWEVALGINTLGGYCVMNTETRIEETRSGGIRMIYPTFESAQARADELNKEPQ